MRGGDSYQFGYLAVGTAKAAGEYASDNRERLASVGGSAMGMVAGAALLGPIGLVAGGVLGGSAGKSTVRAVGGDPKKDRMLALEEESHPSASPQQPNVPPDFLFGKNSTHMQSTPEMDGNLKQDEMTRDETQPRNYPQKHTVPPAFSPGNLKSDS